MPARHASRYFKLMINYMCNYITIIMVTVMCSNNVAEAANSVRNDRPRELRSRPSREGWPGVERKMAASPRER
jgi:hypothetical protein